MLFCVTLFSQDNVAFYNISIIGGNGTNNINANCQGGDFYIPVGISSSMPITDVIEIINEHINGRGHDDIISVISITYDHGCSCYEMLLRVSRNGYYARSLRLSGENGGYVILTQEACPSEDVSLNTNWIMKTTYRSIDTAQFNRSITYYDDFGAPEQSILIKASPTHKNIVQPIVYDNMRRSDAKTYLPYVSTETAAKKEISVLAKQKQFYATKFNTADGNYAYTEKVYESARPVSKIYNVGDIYRSQNKYKAYSYETNSANEVFLFDVDIHSGNLTVSGYYTAGELFKNSVTNEDGIKFTTYTDKSGNTVLTRAKDNSNQNVDTYYAYDYKGQLRWTLSPEGSAILVNGTTYQTDSDLAAKYCYIYKYDGRGNVIERQLPGRDVEYLIYDKAGRLVLSQDGNMRVNNQWIYNVYDNIDNLTDVTLVTSTLTRSVIQAKYYANNFYNDYNSLGNSYSIYCPFGESNDFLTEYLISSTRYNKKSYYLRNNLPSGTYLKYNSAANTTSSSSAHVGNNVTEMSRASIDISGISIKPPKTPLPDGYTLFDLGKPLDPDDEPDEPEEPEGPDCPGIPVDPEDPGEPDDPEIPIDEPENPLICTCDEQYEYTINDPAILIKDQYLVYTDANNPNIKYYSIPSQYMDIAQCIASCNSTYSIFIGMPEGVRTITWETSPLAFAEVAGVCTFADLNTETVKNMKAYEIIKILADNSDYVERAFYYDKYGRLIQTVEKNHLGNISRYSTKYDFAGNMLSLHESHEISTSATDQRLTVFTYDHRGRMLTETVTVNNNPASTTTMSFQYDELGQPLKKIFGNNTVVETKTYNIQGQLTRKQAKTGDNNIFDLQFTYHETTKVAKSYAGNITELTWQHHNNAVQSYTYIYDKLNRLKNSFLYVGNVQTNAFAEKEITYDRNGNILTLQRYSEAGVLDNSLGYTYDGNKLVNLTGVAANTYIYDVNGNMTHDGRRGFDVEYNFLDLVNKVKESNTIKATYAYLADGTKLGVKDVANQGFDYLGSMVYVRDNNTLNIESTAFAGGRINHTTNGYEINYFITDHLGSTRVVVGYSGNITNQSDYYPFGKRHENPNLINSVNRWEFSSKERQTTGEVDYMDFGSRMYDDFLGRWFTHDLQSEKYCPISPYVYCLNNPLIYIDPNGEFIFTVLAAIFCPPLISAATQLDMAWMQGAFTSMANGGSFWSGAGKGFVVGLANAGLSFLNVPGMIPNGLLHAGGNVLTNGLSNVMYGNDFWQGAGWQAGFGFAGGAYSGYQLSKENGLNYLWGNKIRYGRNQWSFFTSEKPYETVRWDVSNVGSKSLNDCVPTSYAEMNDYFGGNTSYDEYRRITGYKEDVGVVGSRPDYERMLERNFTGDRYNASNLADPQVARNIQNNGQLIHTNMPHSGIKHADNLRSISYYSNKTVLRYRIGSYKLSSVNENWWFYLFNGVR